MFSSNHSSFELRHQTQHTKINHEYVKSLLYYQLPIIINSTANLILKNFRTFVLWLFIIIIYKHTNVINYEETCSLINYYISYIKK